MKEKGPGAGDESNEPTAARRSTGEEKGGGRYGGEIFFRGNGGYKKRLYFLGPLCGTDLQRSPRIPPEIRSESPNPTPPLAPRNRIDTTKHPSMATIQREGGDHEFTGQ